jgi:exodeoxyribonuclease V beta subunit
MAMFRRLLFQEGVRERLMALPDGERRLTNILHISEVLHAEAIVQKLGPSGLLKWLSRQRNPETARREEHELRLESDEDAVKIVTIHKSKGIEYPIVFCPFNWGGSGVKGPAFTYHEQEAESGDWHLCLALDGRANRRLADAERESLAENIRILYVALTRAKHRCYLVWGPFNEGKTSAPAYLFHPPAGSSGHTLEVMGNRFLALSDGEIRDHLLAIAARSRGTIHVTDMPSAPGVGLPPVSSAEADLTCRTFSGRIERTERIASFSYFLAGRMAEPAAFQEGRDDLPDRDAACIATTAASGEPPEGFFAFPRGAGAGTLLHDILEHLDFQDGQGAMTKKLVAAKLKEHGFDARWEATVLDMISKLLRIPLDGYPSPFTLSQVPGDERVSEMEFYFPLKATTSDTLKSIFAGAGRAGTSFPDHIGRLSFQPARGFMKGYIDLFFRHDGRFYLIDWKSNFLGNHREDYGQEALTGVMEDDYYVLQYHLYTLALHLYLKGRVSDYDYDRHFGGVFYIFLRGLDPARGAEFGLFRDRPGLDMIRVLEEGLIEVPR